MGYKYQLHTHTAPCSKCAVMTPAELCEGLSLGGFSGCVLTNHFYNGNSGIDRAGGWKNFVRAYEKDYEDCLAEAKKYDLDIIFGVEEHIGGGKEILCYGIPPRALYEHPELAEMQISNWINVAKEYDALIIQAHPFRVRGYITAPGPLSLDLIDGIELYNAGNLPEANEEAEVFAKNNPTLIFTSGADTHSQNTVTHGGLEFDSRIKTSAELVSALRKGGYKIIKG